MDSLITAAAQPLTASLAGWMQSARYRVEFISNLGGYGPGVAPSPKNGAGAGATDTVAILR
jgi:hypothetical protein